MMIRKQPLKYFAALTLLALVNQILFPVVAKALTGGPTQPEVQQFQHVGANNLVDPFTGDFSYSIPLLDVGGYPVNLSYRSGIQSDQEASWVGLGWNLSVGAISRNLRGLPDEFNGDVVTTYTDMNPVVTHAVNLGPAYEIIGLEEEGKIQDGDFIAGLNVNLGVYHNSLTGLGFQFGVGGNYTLFAGTEKGAFKGWGLGGGVNQSFDSQGGATLSMSANLSRFKNDQSQFRQGAGTSVNSRSGMRSLNLNAGVGRFGRSGTRFNFAHPTYTPRAQTPLYTSSINRSFKFGLEVIGLSNIDLSISGSVNTQSVAQRELETPAFGYANASFSGDNESVLLDFNRERDGSFSKQTPNLPLAHQTYDIYQVSGHGVGGSFRFQRGDAGVVFDNRVVNLSEGNNGGLDLAGGGTAAVGANLGGSNNTSETGLWDTYLNAKVAYKGPQVDDLYEAAVPRMMGELVPFETSHLDNLGGTHAVAPELDGGLEVEATAQLVGKGVNMFLSDNTRNERVRRNTSVRILNGTEANDLGLQKTIPVYDLSGDGITPSTYLDRTTGDRKAHHPSEIYVQSANGGHHVYGIPALSKEQLDISFSIGGDEFDDNPDTGVDYTDGLISYTPSQTTDIRKGKGRDGYYTETSTPAHAHSYLLSAYLSHDYEDVSQDGPTPDDHGAYVKFNYGRLAEDYKWRFPYESNQAKHNRGFREDPTDDRANISYGEKEIWYLKGIETRDYVAVFTMSDRQDAKEAAGVNGGQGTTNLQKLDRIDLFSRRDYTANPSTATPIKSVHFGYDYLLCGNTPNSNATGGKKLTLTSLHFTHYDSERGSRNAYTFDYGSFNPDYNPGGNDRWGCYKSSDPNWDGDDVTNSDFPYVEQNRAQADQWAAAWNLHEISLPSGGSMSIDYEADDYGYVQDRRAMQMKAIHGFADNANGTNIDDELYNLDDAQRNKLYLYFDLAEPLPNTTKGRDYLAEQYFAANENLLYFRALTKINGNKIAFQTDHHEYVNGYARLRTLSDGSPWVGLDPTSVSNGEATRAWVRLDWENAKDIKQVTWQAHPFALAGMQMTRNQQPQLIFPGYSPGTDAGEALKGLVASVGEMADFMRNAYKVMHKRNFCRTIVPEKSFVRLTEPTAAKIGGGVRVKRLTVNDHWGDLSAQGHASGSYAQEFIYQKLERIPDVDGDGIMEERMVSTGVAAYEPLVGGDENPFRQPMGHKDGVNYLVKNFLAPDDRLYQEGPIGESLFPSPVVGYSQVLVRNVGHLDQNGAAVTETNAPGFVKHEFYTARDFPTYVEHTDVEVKPRNFVAVVPFVGSLSQRNMTAAQGFYIEKNDMHGKPKGTWAYGENALGENGAILGWPISGTEYKYQTSEDDPRRLSNSVRLLDADLALSEGNVGMEVDMATDLRSSKQVAVNLNVYPQFDVNGGIVGASSWFNGNREERTFHSAAITKVVERYGVLEEVVTWDRQASIPAENLVFDAVSGQSLLTRTWNEFGQPIYDFSWPAYWAYEEGMGAASTNEGFTASDVYFDLATDPNAVVLPNVGTNPLIAGDVVLLDRNNQLVGPYWVNKVSGSTVWLVDADGDYPSSTLTSYSNYKLKVLHPGRQNQHLAAMASVSSLGNPLEMVGGVETFDVSNLYGEVVNAGAVEFSDRWKTFCIKNNSIETTTTALDKWVSRYGNGLPPVVTDYNNGPAGEFFVVENVVTVGTETTITYTLYNTNGTQVDQSFVSFTHSISQACNNTAFQNENVAASSPTGTYEISFDVYCSVANQTLPCSLSFSGSDVTWGSGGTRPANLAGCYESGDHVNPWLQGLRNNWRPLRSHAYLTDRTASSNGPDLRSDGVYADFTPFWTLSNGDWTSSGTSSNQWQKTNTATVFHPRGLEVENEDALGNFSAAITGYDASLVRASAQNARYNELLFEDFEDYVLRDPANDCELYQWDMIAFAGDMSTEKAHTGLRSLKVTGVPAVKTSYVDEECNIAGNLLPSDGYKYALNCGDCLELFEPNTEKPDGSAQTYVFYAWASEDLTGRMQPRNLVQPEVVISFNGSTTSYTIKPSGAVIDGWQRMEFEFSIPSSTSEIEISLGKADLNGPDVYYDDVRISPYDAGMTSYVYEVDNRRLMAEMDANHYATFYEYDEDGSLIRVKKETERGVMTIQENRANLAKQGQ